MLGGHRLGRVKKKFTVRPLLPGVELFVVSEIKKSKMRVDRRSLLQGFGANRGESANTPYPMKISQLPGNPSWEQIFCTTDLASTRGEPISPSGPTDLVQSCSLGEHRKVTSFDAAETEKEANFYSRKQIPRLFQENS